MNGWRTHLVFYSMVGMVASLFISRFLLSSFILLFFLVSFFHHDIKSQFRKFFSSPLLWGVSLLFLLPLISGLWSEDKEKWLEITVRKLPLLLLPLGFAAPFTFSKKQWELLAFIFIVFVTGATFWSMFHYTLNIQVINESYLKAKSIITPLENDHVRFSWLVSITLLLSVCMWWQIKGSKTVISKILLLIGVWLAIYLHILAARTGLFSFYIMAFAAICWLIMKQRKFLTGAILFLLLAVLPVMAYWLLPSFQNRVKYILYDYSYFKKLQYLPGGNDAVRVISLKAGWNILNENPSTGVGAGDVLAETKKWYKQHYPDMLETDMLYPASEWLAYGDACGWPGLLMFTGVMIIPFFSRRRYNIVWLLLNITAAGSLLFDIGLEVQFGIFIYSFIVLWWWKWLVPQNEITLTND